MSQADDDDKQPALSRPDDSGATATTERNRKDGPTDDRTATTDEALATLLARIGRTGQVSTTLDDLAETWTTSPAGARKRLQRWEARGHVICGWPGGGQVSITSKLSTRKAVDTPTAGNLPVVDTRGQPNDSKGLPRKLFPVDTDGGAVSRVIARYVDNPVDIRGQATLSTNAPVDTPTVAALSTALSSPANVVQFPGRAAPSNLAVREEEIRGLFEKAAETVQPDPPKARRLPIFRNSNGLRLVSAAAVAVGIAMIAYHSAGAAAANSFIWATTLAMAVILSTGKVVLGAQAEGFFAHQDRTAGWWCVIGALFLLSVDASLLYAFRGDSLSNAAAMEKAQMETRQRHQTRLDGLMSEQQRLQAEAGRTVTTTSVRLVAEVEADLRILESVGDCRMIQPRAKRGHPTPAPAPANSRGCETKKAALQAEKARAEDAAGDEARSVAAAEKREKRLAELPHLIEAAERELGQMAARATPDHGASIVARGLNWVPAGISSLWGADARPVEGRGVEIFWSWAFVLAAELFAVGGFAIAARADRRARKAA